MYLLIIINKPPYNNNAMLPGTAIPSASIAELIVLAVNIPPKKYDPL